MEHRKRKGNSFYKRFEPVGVKGLRCQCQDYPWYLEPENLGICYKWPDFRHKAVFSCAGSACVLQIWIWKNLTWRVFSVLEKLVVRRELETKYPEIEGDAIMSKQIQTVSTQLLQHQHPLRSVTYLRYVHQLRIKLQTWVSHLLGRCQAHLLSLEEMDGSG